MKMSLELSTEEIARAIAEFAARKLGKDGTVDMKITLTSTPNYDSLDRPTGTNTITATASFEDEVKP